jgi:signal transduction histidine kinase
MGMMLKSALGIDPAQIVTMAQEAQQVMASLVARLTTDLDEIKTSLVGLKGQVSGLEIDRSVHDDQVEDALDRIQTVLLRLEERLSGCEPAGETTAPPDPSLSPVAFLVAEPDGAVGDE